MVPALEVNAKAQVIESWLLCQGPSSGQEGWSVKGATRTTVNSSRTIKPPAWLSLGQPLAPAEQGQLDKYLKDYQDWCLSKNCCQRKPGLPWNLERARDDLILLGISPSLIQFEEIKYQVATNYPDLDLPTLELLVNYRLAQDNNRTSDLKLAKDQIMKLMITLKKRSLDGSLGIEEKIKWLGQLINLTTFCLDEKIDLTSLVMVPALSNPIIRPAPKSYGLCGLAKDSPYEIILRQTDMANEAESQFWNETGYFLQLPSPETGKSYAQLLYGYARSIIIFGPETIGDKIKHLSPVLPLGAYNDLTRTILVNAYNEKGQKRPTWDVLATVFHEIGHLIYGDSEQKAYSLENEFLKSVLKVYSNRPIDPEEKMYLYKRKEEAFIRSRIDY